MISRKQINDSILIFHKVVNKFWATVLNLAKDSKLLSYLAKSAFDISFVNENAESVSENICEKSRKKSKKKKNKKKSKTDKKLIKNVDLFEWECMFKKIISSFKNHLNDSKSKNQIFKKWQCHIYNDFHFYRKCYYLFSSFTHENWISRAEIKKMIKKVLNENEDFAEKIKKLQKIMKKKNKKNWFLMKSIEKI